MTTLLLAAFQPFGGEPVNPAALAVATLADRAQASAGDGPAASDLPRIVTASLPVVRFEAQRVLAAAVAEHRPDAVIVVGQAGGSTGLRIERVAINLDDFPIPDEAGNQPVDAAICDDGAAAHFATLPVRAIVDDLRAEGIPARLSNDAGTFVCNHVLYGLLELLAAEHPGVLGGFVHVPYAPSQVVAKAGKASMPTDLVARGLAVVARATAAAVHPPA